MAKLSDMDKILEHLESSIMLKKLVLTIKRYWQGESEQLTLTHTPKSVSHTLDNIVNKKQAEQAQVIEKIIEVEKIVKVEVPVEKIVEKRVEIPVERIVEKRIELTPQWAKSLESELTFLKQVQNHPELASILLPNGDENLLQLIAISSQWNNVLRVWDALAIQVKKTQQTISTTEQQILEHSLALFNLTLQSNQAILQSPELGASYDYDIHQKVSGSGSSIEQVLLAGLYNAASDNVRTAIVATR